MAFMGGGVPGLPDTRPGFWVTGAAGFELEEEMKAAFAMRKGWRVVAAVGLAVLLSVSWSQGCWGAQLATYRAAPWPSLALSRETWLRM